ncbi:hypothetical protein [Vibrio harveyi]|uniref:hypothetical protein n=1 Tax=Vibrio harveyi TaxID=669 RepID=UPI0018F275CD|nr:hypothetical protein [Vibrio harveyi]
MRTTISVSGNSAGGSSYLARALKKADLGYKTIVMSVRKGEAQYKVVAQIIEEWALLQRVATPNFKLLVETA